MRAPAKRTRSAASRSWAPPTKDRLVVASIHDFEISREPVGCLQADDGEIGERAAFGRIEAQSRREIVVSPIDQAEPQWEFLVVQSPVDREDKSFARRTVELSARICDPYRYV